MKGKSSSALVVFFSAGTATPRRGSWGRARKALRRSWKKKSPLPLSLSSFLRPPRVGHARRGRALDEMSGTRGRRPAAGGATMGRPNSSAPTRTTSRRGKASHTHSMPAGLLLPNAADEGRK